MNKRIKPGLFTKSSGFTPPPIKPVSLARGAGFTLIEILLVVTIVAILITIATPGFRNSLTTIQLANTTQDMAQLMRFLRLKAVNERCVFQLKLDLAKRRYLAQKVTAGGTVQYDISKVIPRGVNVAATINPISFYPDGTIDQASIFLFKGKEDFYKDLERAINKEFELGQIQTVSHTEFVYTITTKPSIGRIEVITPM